MNKDKQCGREWLLFPQVTQGLETSRTIKNLEWGKCESVTLSWQGLQVFEKLEGNRMARGQQVCLSTVSRFHGVCCLRVTDPRLWENILIRILLWQATETNSNHFRRDS